MGNKKPTLNQFGLTQQQVRDNEYAKKNRQRIINQNNEIDNNATKYGWITFFISLFILVIIGVNSDGGDLSFLFIIISAVIGFITSSITKSTKQEVPIYSKAIEDKYQKYLEAVANYKVYEESQKARISKHTSSIKTKASSPNTTSTKTATTKTTSTKSTISDSITIPAPIITQNNIQLIKTKINKSTEYQVGMIVQHSTYGVGKIVHINEDKTLIDVKFDDNLNYKKFLTSIVKLQILETPKPKTAPIKVESKIIEQLKPAIVDRHKDLIKENEELSIVYKNSNIGLTKKQEEIFNKMLDISLKFCVELQIDDRKQIVGVGLPNQEKLRYYISKKSNKIYVKFTDSDKPIFLEEKNKTLLFEMTKNVNNKFESNPEQYQLYKYKEELKQKEQVTILEEDTDDIFDFDDETSKISIKENVETSANIIFDNTVFSIDNTTLLRCYSNNKQNSYDIPNGITEIADNAFLSNTDVHNIIIPETVTKIGNNAFKDCKELRDLVLPGSIKEIGTHAFDGCNNLETLFCNTKAVEKLLTDLPKHIEIVCLEF